MTDQDTTSRNEYSISWRLRLKKDWYRTLPWQFETRQRLVKSYYDTHYPIEFYSIVPLGDIDRATQRVIS